MAKPIHHAFAKSIDQEIKPLYELDNLHAPRALLAFYASIALCVVVCEATDNPVWHAVFYAGAVVVIGCIMRGFATLLHESAHRTLARSPWLNDAIGTYGSGYLILQSRSAYRKSHVLEHHVWLGDPDRDPEYAFHLREGLYNETSQFRFLLRHLLLPLVFYRNPQQLRELLHQRLIWKNKYSKEIAHMTVYLGVLCGLVLYLGGGWLVFKYWLVPFFTVFPVVNWYNELFEHFPYPPQGTTDLELSRNRWPNLLERLFTGLLNENYHLVHHLRPRIPYWNLPRAHRIFLQDAAYRSLHEVSRPLLFSGRSGTLSLLQLITRPQSRIVK